MSKHLALLSQIGLIVISFFAMRYWGQAEVALGRCRLEKRWIALHSLEVLDTVERGMLTGKFTPPFGPEIADAVDASERSCR